VRASGYSTIVVNRVRHAYCDHKLGCRLARHGAFGTRLKLVGASTAALGTAVIAADYVVLPWWSRLLPRGARDELRRRFAGPLAAAVEEHVQRRERAAP
jgi:hypothetical protein